MVFWIILGEKLKQMKEQREEKKRQKAEAKAQQAPQQSYYSQPSGGSSGGGFHLPHIKIVPLILILLIGSAVVLMLYPIVAPLGFSGVINSITDLFGGAKDVGESATDAYMQQVQQAMGLSYATEIDEYADADVGFSLRDVNPSQTVYHSADPVSIWWKAEGKAPSRDRRLNVSFDCWHEGRDTARGSVEKTEGMIRPTRSLFIDQQMSADMRCEFPQGILSSDFSNRFNVRAKFNFETMGYVTASFIDDNAYFALERSNPERLTQLQKQPITQNTYAPVEVGIGSQSFPIIISSEGSTQLQPYLGFSFTNNWNGFIQNLTDFTVLVPKGIELVDCDGMTDMIRRDEFSDEFFTNYTLSNEGLEHISSRITSTTNSRSFVPQNFKCFMVFDPEKLFEERNRLDPISLNIFAFAEYDYMLIEEKTVNPVTDYDEVTIDLEPSIIGLHATPTVTVDEPGLLKELSSARFTLKYRKSGELESNVVEGYENVELIKGADKSFSTRISEPLSEIIGDLSRGDSVIFEFNVVKDDGEPYKAVKVARILNNAPEVLEDGLYFSPSTPGTYDSIECFARASDPDGDDIESATFVFRNMQTQERYEIPDSTCEQQEDHWLCFAQLSEEETNVNDVIECSVTLYDGVDYNRDTPKIQTTIQAGTSGDTDFVPEEPCESSDGIDIRSQGTTSGVNEEDVSVSRTDYCDDENTLVEFYCEENIVKSNTYTCNCYSGACI